MTIRRYFLGPDGNLKRDLSDAKVRQAFEAKEGLLWVDLTRSAAEYAQQLRENFGFHHLAVEDCVSTAIHHPKIDDFDDHLFMVVHGINHSVEGNVVETAELALFFGPNFVVSSHHVPLYSVDAIARMVEDDARPMRRGADFLVHSLVDALVDNVLPTIERMSEVAEDLEEEAISRPHQATLEGVMALKRSALRIHRITAPQREIMNRLARGEFAVVRDEARIFYRDVYDHMLRIENLVDSLRDSADTALATYLSAVAIQQNETMRVLSIVAAVFLPLTLVAAIYGMNFENMPELEWSWSYFAVLGLMATVAAGALWWFWARRWIAAGRRRVPRIQPFAVDIATLVGHLAHGPNRAHE